MSNVNKYVFAVTSRWSRRYVDVNEKKIKILPHSNGHKFKAHSPQWAAIGKDCRNWRNIPWFLDWVWTSFLGLMTPNGQKIGLGESYPTLIPRTALIHLHLQPAWRHTEDANNGPLCLASGSEFARNSFEFLQRAFRDSCNLPSPWIDRSEVYL